MSSLFWGIFRIQCDAAASSICPLYEIFNGESPKFRSSTHPFSSLHCTTWLWFKKNKQKNNTFPHISLKFSCLWSLGTFKVDKLKRSVILNNSFNSSIHTEGSLCHCSKAFICLFFRAFYNTCYYTHNGQSVLFLLSKTDYCTGILNHYKTGNNKGRV